MNKNNTPQSDNSNSSPRDRERTFLIVLKKSTPRLKKVAWMFYKLKEDREELIQEVIYRAWSAWPGFRNEADAMTWFHSIAFRTAANWRRDAKRFVKVEDIPDQGYVPDSDDDKLEVIASLRNSEKEIILLMMDGYEYEEISPMLNVPSPNIANRISRLRKRLGIKSK